MKKLISILAVSMLLACSFTSCGDSDDGSESTSKNSKTSASSTSDEDETEEDETDDNGKESNTKSTKKSKEKSTEEETTTKNSKKEKTTKEKSTGTVSPEDLPGEPGGDIIGKWNIDEDTLEMIMGDSDLKGMEIGDCYMEFGDDGMCSITFTLDMSSVMCIKDEKPIELYGEDISSALQDKSLFIGGINAPIYDFDGKSFRAGFKDKYYTFTRDKKSDEIYGEYDAPADFSNDSISAIDFPSSGKAYMYATETKDYIYDDDKGTITSNNSDKEPTYIRFIDDDTFILADAEGIIGTLNRAD